MNQPQTVKNPEGMQLNPAIVAKQRQNPQEAFGVGLQVQNFQMNQLGQDAQLQQQPFGQQPYMNQSGQYLAQPVFYNGYAIPVNALNQDGNQQTQQQFMMPITMPPQGYPVSMIPQGYPMPLQGGIIGNNNNAFPQQMMMMDGNLQIKFSDLRRLRKSLRWFTGSNACFLILIVLNTISMISLSGDQTSQVAEQEDLSYFRENDIVFKPNNLVKTGAIICAASLILWFIMILTAIQGLTSNKLYLLNRYIKGLYVVVAFFTLGNILIFAGFKLWKPMSKTMIVIFYIISLIIIYSFIKNAKKIQLTIEHFKQKYNTNPLDPFAFNQNINQNPQAPIQQNQL